MVDVFIVIFALLAVNILLTVGLFFWLQHALDSRIQKTNTDYNNQINNLHSKLEKDKKELHETIFTTYQVLSRDVNNVYLEKTYE